VVQPACAKAKKTLGEKEQSGEIVPETPGAIATRRETTDHWVQPQSQTRKSTFSFTKGFSLLELKAAGLGAAFARSVGVKVDHRRRNKSQESLDLNKRRL
jgi:ribosomal protein L13E